MRRFNLTPLNRSLKTLSGSCCSGPGLVDSPESGGECAPVECGSESDREYVPVDSDGEFCLDGLDSILDSPGSDIIRFATSTGVYGHSITGADNWVGKGRLKGLESTSSQLSCSGGMGSYD